MFCFVAYTLSVVLLLSTCTWVLISDAFVFIPELFYKKFLAPSNGSISCILSLFSRRKLHVYEVKPLSSVDFLGNKNLSVTQHK